MSPNPFSVVTAHPPSLDLQRRITQERVPTIGTTPDRAGARPYHRSARRIAQERVPTIGATPDRAGHIYHATRPATTRSRHY